MPKATITIEGFVSKDVETRAAGSHTIASVSVPVAPRKLVNGEWVEQKDKTAWWEAEFWNEHGDAVAHNVRKGSLVTITGEPVVDVYLKKDSTPGLSLRIANGTIGVIVRKPSRNGAQNASSPATAPSEPWAASTSAQSDSMGGFDNIDSPF